MKLNPEQIRAAQLKQLEIMVEVDRICRREGLTYYIIGGTLIGAVRHQGFIPWDDDVDISMPREDYERFLKHGQKWLPDRLFLQNYKTEKECYHLFSKIRLNGTFFKERAAEHLSCHHGIFIDIFPLDRVSRDPKMRRRICFLIEQIHKIIFQKLKIVRRSGGAVFYFIRALIGRVCSIRFLGESANWLARRYKHVKTGWVSIPLSPINGEICLITDDQYHKPVEVQFEGVRFFAPANAEAVLREQFGDFMQLPPEEKRVGGHDIAEFKL